MLDNRVELSTPMNSAKRRKCAGEMRCRPFVVWECVHLRRLGNAYASSACHEQPLLIAALAPLADAPTARVFVYVLADLVIAAFLMAAARAAVVATVRSAAVCRHTFQARQQKAQLKRADASLGKPDVPAEQHLFESTLLRVTDMHYLSLLVAVA
jgi:hypothetical protein